MARDLPPTRLAWPSNPETPVAVAARFEASESPGFESSASVRLLPGAAHFRVEEIPAYLPSGEGEHLYVRIEKIGWTTDMVVSALARTCGCAPREIGFAGRKDRHAVAVQWFSVRGATADSLVALEADFGDHLRVIEHARHANKLRLGHLRGNRFELRLRCSDRDAAFEALREQLEELERGGLPNAFGSQRFGKGGANLRVAAALAEGRADDAVRFCIDPAGHWKLGQPVPRGSRHGPEGRMRAALSKHPDDPERALRAAGRSFRLLMASAAQSHVFNAVLAWRRSAGLLHTVRAGDVVRKVGAGAFLCSEQERAEVQERAAPGRLEVVTTGPLPGTLKLVPSPEVQAEERRWSESTGIAWDWFAKGGPLESPGERRSLVVPFLEAPRIQPDADGDLVLAVGLPRGCYATELLAELGVSVPARRGAASER